MRVQNEIWRNILVYSNAEYHDSYLYTIIVYISEIHLSADMCSCKLYLSTSRKSEVGKGIPHLW